VIIRLLVNCDGADWPLSRKFGCDREMAIELLTRAKNLGLELFGLSFHIGSQQADTKAWETPIREAAAIFQTLECRGGPPVVSSACPQADGGAGPWLGGGCWCARL